MKKYEEFQKMFPEPDIVRPKHTYFGYKDGKGKEFGTRTEAKAYSNLVEEVVTNAEEVLAYKRARNANAKKIEDVWKAALREECTYLDAYGIFDDALSYVASEVGAYKDDTPNHMNEIEVLLIKALRGPKFLAGKHIDIRSPSIEWVMNPKKD